MKNVTVKTTAGLVTGILAVCLYGYSTMQQSTAHDSPLGKEQAAFYHDLDLAHIDNIRRIVDTIPTRKERENFYQGSVVHLGAVYLLDQNKDRVTPAMMRDFYKKAGVKAAYLPGPTEGMSRTIIENNSDPALVEVAIENGLPYKQVYFTRGNTLLHLAVQGDRPRLVKYLAVKHPELLTIRNMAGQTALDLARAERKKHLVKLLTGGAS